MHVITLFQAFLLFSRMHPSLISPQLQLKINELFFPKSETLDIGPSSNSPFAKELAQLFVHGAACDKQCLSKADVLEGFVTMATGYARRTSSIQTVGNSFFRLVLFEIFQPASMKPSFKDAEIMSQRIKVALELKLHEEDISDLSPVGASDDENPPLLRSQTTTPITMMESLGQHLLIWDHETRQLFDVIVAELFGCPAPGAAAVSKRDLEALVHAAGDGSDQARQILETYAPLWVLHPDDCLTRDSVRLIFEKMCTLLLSRQDFFCAPVRAYIRRKLQPVIRAVESIKVYEEGKEYMVYIVTPSGETLKVRCRLLKRLDVQRFRVVVKFAGQNIQLIAPMLMELGPDEFTDEDSDDWDDAPLQPDMFESAMRLIDSSLLPVGLLMAAKQRVMDRL
jgi:hypothetical protein